MCLSLAGITTQTRSKEQNYNMNTRTDNTDAAMDLDRGEISRWQIMLNE